MSIDRPDTAPALPGIFRLGWVRAGGEVKQFFRERDAVIFIFAYPIVMLAIFATVFGQGDARVGTEPDGSGGIPFAQYFLPGMVATGLMLTSFQNLALMIAAERDEGTLKRLRGTPLPATSYFLRQPAAHCKIRGRNRHAGRDRAPVHLRGLLRVHGPTRLDAACSRGLPAQVVGTGDAFGVPPC